jgi:hypothetical protein
MILVGKRMQQTHRCRVVTFLESSVRILEWPLQTQAHQRRTPTGSAAISAAAWRHSKAELCHGRR